MGWLNDRKRRDYSAKFLHYSLSPRRALSLPSLAVSFVTVKRQMNDNGKQAQRDFDEISVDVHAARSTPAFSASDFPFFCFVPEHPANMKRASSDSIEKKKARAEPFRSS